MKVGFDCPVGVFSAAIGPLKPGGHLQVARERSGIDLGGLVRKGTHDTTVRSLRANNSESSSSDLHVPGGIS